MRKFYLFILSLVVVLDTYSQATWLTPSPHGYNIRDVKYLDANTLITVGDRSCLYRSIDKGFTWTKCIIPPTYDFQKTSFANTSIGWVVGFAGGIGSIFKTTDGGATWAPQSSGYSSLFSVLAINTLIAYATGANGLILKTIDGGISWNAQSAGVIEVIRNIFFTDINNGWAIGDNGTILSTTNAGATWLPKISGVTNQLSDLYFSTPTTGWICGSGGTILFTSDGNTFPPQVSGTTQSLNNIKSAGGSTLIAVGNTNTILKTSNGGTTWVNQSGTVPLTLIVAPLNFLALSVLDVNNYYIVGNKGYMFSTNNAGASFSEHSSRSISHNHDLTSVSFINNSQGWACALAGKLYRSVDGGVHWTLSNSGTANDLYAIQFVNGSTGWVCGSNGKVKISTDGGLNFVDQVSNTTQNLYGMSMIDANIGWAVGNNGTIIKTINGGVTWAIQNAGVITSINAIHALSSTLAWACGTNGVILKTSDGVNWLPLISGTTTYLSSLNFVNSSTGWVAGNNGLILKTVNGGTSWTSQVTDNFSGLTAIKFKNTTEGIAGGLNGKVLFATNDGGTTWTAKQDIFPTQTLAALTFTDANTMVGVGNNGIAIQLNIPALLPINLTNFKGYTKEQHVKLNWQTGMEQNNSGFEVLRSTPNGKAETIGFVRSKGNSSLPQSYSFTDEPTGGNVFHYQLKQIDLDGKNTFSNILKIKLDISSLSLTNYPNPFSNQTTINYSLPVAVNVTLTFRDQFGNVVKNILNKHQSEGNYALTVNTNTLAAGQYYCELKVGSSKRSIKLSIVK
jgi:photosystem II stability/assembly factor-like uncharacterized protein